MAMQEDYETNMWKAVVEGDVREVKDQLLPKDNVNSWGTYKLSLVHIAAHYGQVEVLAHLLKRKAEVNKLSKARSIARNVSHPSGAPLHLAVANGHDECTRLLVSKGADMNLKNKDGTTPIEEALRNGQVGCIKVLIECEAEVKDKIALYIAAAVGDVDRLSSVLLDVEKIDKPYVDGNTALHLASRHGQSACVKLLIEKGCDINVKNRFDNTPLHETAIHKQTDCAKLLLEQGADINAWNKKRNTPLFEAVILKHTDCVLLLLEKGAKINLQNNEGDTSLHEAVTKRHTDCALVLMKQGADMNLQNEVGDTPLHEAVRKRHTDCAMLLMKLHADLNIPNKEENTPLHEAARLRHTDCAMLLIKQGADLNAPNMEKNTPLHESVLNGHTDCALCLMKQGAGVDFQNIKGNSPLHESVLKQHADCAMLLITHGADFDTLCNNEGFTAEDLILKWGNQQVIDALTEEKCRRQMFAAMAEESQTPDTPSIQIEWPWLKLPDDLVAASTELVEGMEVDMQALTADGAEQDIKALDPSRESATGSGDQSVPSEAHEMEVDNHLLQDAEGLEENAEMLESQDSNTDLQTEPMGTQSIEDGKENANEIEVNEVEELQVVPECQSPAQAKPETSKTEDQSKPLDTDLEQPAAMNNEPSTKSQEIEGVEGNSAQDILESQEDQGREQHTVTDIDMSTQDNADMELKDGDAQKELISNKQNTDSALNIDRKNAQDAETNADETLVNQETELPVEKPDKIEAEGMECQDAAADQESRQEGVLSHPDIEVQAEGVTKKNSEEQSDVQQKESKEQNEIEADSNEDTVHNRDSKTEQNVTDENAEPQAVETNIHESQEDQGSEQHTVTDIEMSTQDNANMELKEGDAQKELISNDQNGVSALNVEQKNAQSQDADANADETLVNQEAGLPVEKPDRTEAEGMESQDAAAEEESGQEGVLSHPDIEVQAEGVSMKKSEEQPDVQQKESKEQNETGSDSKEDTVHNRDSKTEHNVTDKSTEPQAVETNIDEKLQTNPEEQLHEGPPHQDTPEVVDDQSTKPGFEPNIQMESEAKSKAEARAEEVSISQHDRLVEEEMVTIDKVDETHITAESNEDELSELITHFAGEELQAVAVGVESAYKETDEASKHVKSFEPEIRLSQDSNQLLLVAACLQAISNSDASQKSGSVEGREENSLQTGDNSNRTPHEKNVLPSSSQNVLANDPVSQDLDQSVQVSQKSDGDKGIETADNTQEEEVLIQPELQKLQYTKPSQRSSGQRLSLFLHGYIPSTKSQQPKPDDTKRGLQNENDISEPTVVQDSDVTKVESQLPQSASAAMDPSIDNELKKEAMADTVVQDSNIVTMESQSVLSEPTMMDTHRDEATNPAELKKDSLADTGVSMETPKTNLLEDKPKTSDTTPADEVKDLSEVKDETTVPYVSPLSYSPIIGFNDMNGAPTDPSLKERLVRLLCCSGRSQLL